MSLCIKINNPLEPTYFLSGKHDGFPSYEIYINAESDDFPVTEVLTWSPELNVGVTELFSNLDIEVGDENGSIQQ